MPSETAATSAVAAPAPRVAPVTSRAAFALKWGASVIQIMGYTATAAGWTPWNIYLFLVGLLGWFTVGLLWNDKAIMLIHIVALGAMLAGMSSG